MGNFSKDDNRGGGFRGGFNRGGGRSFGRGGGRGDRQMFDTTCSNCGKACQVPFRPTNGKPVYCSDCFEKMGGGRGDSRRFDDRSRTPQAQGGPDLSAINAKLDKILSILEPKVAIPVVEEVKAPKAKKAVKKAAPTKKK